MIIHSNGYSKVSTVKSSSKVIAESQSYRDDLNPYELFANRIAEISKQANEEKICLTSDEVLKRDRAALLRKR